MKTTKTISVSLPIIVCEIMDKFIKDFNERNKTNPINTSQFINIAVCTQLAPAIDKALNVKAEEQLAPKENH